MFKDLEKEEHDIQHNIAPDELFNSCSFTKTSGSMKETNEPAQDDESDQIIIDELNVTFSSKKRVFLVGPNCFKKFLFEI